MNSPKTQRIARAVADVGGGSLLASVEIAATPERVYRALTTPDEVVKWWGSEQDYRTTSWTSELRVGGHWRAEGRSLDGTPFSVEGEYLELEPPHKIVCTWVAAWDGNHPTTITYRLEPIDGGTRVVVRHEGFADRIDSCRGHSVGWERVLGWLTDFLALVDHEARYFMIRLLPPRPSFMQDMSPDEKAMMAEHARYWAGLLQLKKAVVFGPVADPNGGFGLAVACVDSEAELAEIEAADPAIRAARGLSYEVLPMLRAVHAG